MQNWEKHWRNLEAYAGAKTCWELNFPSRAFINKIVLIQTGGTTASQFYLDIFNSALVCSGGASVSVGGDTPSADPDLYRVCPTLENNGPNDSPGRLLRFWDDGGGPQYVNQDGRLVNMIRKIYLELEIPTGGDMTTWDLALGAHKDIG